VGRVPISSAGAIHHLASTLREAIRLSIRVGEVERRINNAAGALTDSNRRARVPKQNNAASGFDYPDVAKVVHARHPRSHQVGFVRGQHLAQPRHEHVLDDERD